MKKKWPVLLMVFGLVCLIAACGAKETSQKRTLGNLADYLVEQSVVAGEQSKEEPELVGAKAGFGYEASGVVVYEYDTKSDVYKNIVSTKVLEVPKHRTNLKVAAVNGPFVLILSGETEDAVIDAFTSYQ